MVQDVDRSAVWLFQPPQPVQTTDDGPLGRLTFAVKDNIDVAGWPTTAACPAFAYTAIAHATVVQRLLDACLLYTSDAADE